MPYLVILGVVFASRLISKFFNKKYLGTLLIFIGGLAFVIMLITTDIGSSWARLGHLLGAFMLFVAMVLDLIAIFIIELVKNK